MEHRATLPALAGALVLTTAAACAWVFGTYVVAESYDDYVKRQRPQPYHPFEWVTVTPEGEPLIAVNQSSVRHSAERLLNIDRSVVRRDPMPVLVQYVTLMERRDVGEGIGRRHGNRFMLLQDESRPPREPDVRPENWYFVMDDMQTGRGWLEGYDQGTRRRIGYIGRNGLSAAPPAVADQFAPAPGDMLGGATQRCVLQFRDFFKLYGDHNTTAVHFDGKYPVARRQCLILDDAGVHLVDLGARTASVLVAGPVDSMAAVSQLEPLPEGFFIDDPQDHWKEDRRYLLKIRLAVRANGTVQLLDLVRRERRELKLPQELQASRIDLMLLGDRQGVVKTFPDEPRREVGNGVEAVKVRLTWFEPDGRVTKQQEMDYWRSSATFSAETGMLLGTVAVPEPLVTAVMVGLNTAFLPASPEAAGVSLRLMKVLRGAWPGIALAAASGALAAWLLERHRRRRRLPRSMGWLAFALLLGLPGYAGYAWHRRWPPVQLAPAPTPMGIEIVVA